MSGLPDSVQFKVVKVVWHDAHAMNAHWMGPDEWDRTPCVVESVGFLIPDAKDGHVVICQSLNTEEHYDSLLAVPVAMVQQVMLLA